MNDIVTNYFVQQGNSGTLRTNSDHYCVVYETWEGSKILGTGVVARYNTRQEAQAEANRLNAQS